MAAIFSLLFLASMSTFSNLFFLMMLCGPLATLARETPLSPAALYMPSLFMSTICTVGLLFVLTLLFRPQGLMGRRT